MPRKRAGDALLSSTGGSMTVSRPARRPNVRDETLTVTPLKRLPRASEARHDRSDRNVHDSRHLLVGERLHFAQYETLSPREW
jgi:hypothetical protein